MEYDRERIINDSIDLDTLLVVFLNKIDALAKIFLISFAVFFLLYVTSQRIYQSSTLINFEQNQNLLGTSLPSSSNLTALSQSGLAGEKEIYKSASTVSGAIDRIIQDNALEIIPTVSEISGGLSFSNVSNNLLTVNLEYTEREDTQIILNYLNEEFLKDAIENNQLKAKKGIEFVDNEIPKINLLLEEAEEDLTNFRSASGKYLIFANDGRSDNLTSLEERIKEIEFKELELKEFYKPTHPLYLTLIEQKNLLEDELATLETNIKDIPSEQRTLFNLQQKVNIYSSSLETLEKQKLNLNLSAASSLSNIRIVNDASSASKISPNISMILFSFLIFAAAYGFFLVNHFVTDRILSLDSLLDFLDNRNLFLGAFPQVDPKKDDKSKLLKEIEKNDLDRSSISLIASGKKITTITSMAGGVGKTYFCLKMFNKLHKLGKKVCLIDFDLRKKGLSSNLEKEEFDFVILEDLNLDDEILESCILKAPDDMDPLKFFNSDDLEIFLNKIKDKFDHILIDTPPMGTFIDAKLLCGKSDTIIIILSSHLSTFGEITSMKKEIDSLEKPEIQVKYFLNRVRHFLEIFNYKFRYPLYGDYGYYDYRYHSNDKNSVFSWKNIKKYFIKYKKILLSYLNNRK